MECFWWNRHFLSEDEKKTHIQRKRHFLTLYLEVAPDCAKWKCMNALCKIREVALCESSWQKATASFFVFLKIYNIVKNTRVSEKGSQVERVTDLLTEIHSNSSLEARALNEQQGLCFCGIWRTNLPKGFHQQKEDITRHFSMHFQYYCYVPWDEILPSEVYSHRAQLAFSACKDIRISATDPSSECFCSPQLICGLKSSGWSVYRHVNKHLWQHVILRLCSDLLVISYFPDVHYWLLAEYTGTQKMKADFSFGTKNNTIAAKLF